MICKSTQESVTQREGRGTEAEGHEQQSEGGGKRTLGRGGL